MGGARAPGRGQRRAEVHELGPGRDARARAARPRASRRCSSPSTGIVDYRAVAEKLARARREGRRRDPPRRRAVRSVVARAAPTSWSRTDGGDLLGTPGRGLRRPALRRARPARRAPTRACGSSRSAASTPGCGRARRGPGQGPDLPGAGPGVPVPRRARSPAGSTAACTPARTPCSRSPARATRGARVKPEELLGTLRLPRACCGSRGSTGATGSARCTGRCRARRWSARSSGCCPTSGPTTCTRPEPGCGPRRCGRTARLVDDFLFVAQGSGAGAVLHVLNAPSPAATAALPIGREILETLTGEKLGPL